MIVQMIIIQIVASFWIEANSIGENDIENIPEINTQCAGDFDCALLLNSICQNDNCVCAPGYIAKYGACLGGINANCFKSSDCGVENSICIPLGKCICAPNHLYKSNRCIPFAEKVGDECLTDAGCEYLKNSACVDEKCSCLAGYFEINGRCRK